MDKKTVLPNFMEQKPIIPRWVWDILRVVSISCAIAAIAGLFVFPKLFLTIIWGILIPILPIVFFIAPGVWRNICPFATMNQIPRRLKLNRGKKLPNALKDAGYTIAIVLFVLAISLRPFLLNHSEIAIACVIFGMLFFALLGGIIFEGKSGFCSTICPLLPIQRVYGQTPFIPVRNAHCDPCVGCVKNCYDFNPKIAYLADLDEKEQAFSLPRKVFIGSLPGLLLGYFFIDVALTAEYFDYFIEYMIYLLVSNGLFFTLLALLHAKPFYITTLFTVASINIYYWFSLPILFSTLDQLTGVHVPDIVRISLLSVLGFVSLIWIYRTFIVKSQYEKILKHSQLASVSNVKKISDIESMAENSHLVRLEPQGKEFIAKKGVTLLSLMEENNVKIQSGCKMGLCGADPIYVLENENNLSAMRETERQTIDRLGLGPGVRMSCCAMVKGSVSITTDIPKEANVMDNIEIDHALQDKVVIIIGNGIAGMTAADHVRRKYPGCKIKIFAEEAHHFYNRIGITKLISGCYGINELSLMPAVWDEKTHYEVYINTKIDAIDRNNKAVISAMGEKIHYNKLILANGAYPFIPPIDNNDLQGIFSLRAAQDATDIRSYIQQHHCKNAVVVGGGLLGLEAAYALKKLNLNITIIESNHYLLSRQLDEVAGRYLIRHFTDLGIKTLASHQLTKINGQEHITSIDLSSEEELKCDILLFCIGVRSNTDLAKDCQLEVERGVVVNEYLQSSDPDIFAIGDVAEYQGISYGLWMHAVAQGKLAATNLLSQQEKYIPYLPSTILKIENIYVSAIGDVHEKFEGRKVFVIDEPIANRYGKIVVKDNKVVAANFINMKKEASAFSILIKDGVDVSSVIPLLKKHLWLKAAEKLME